MMSPVTTAGRAEELTQLLGEHVTIDMDPSGAHLHEAA
jgi:hypothetical protein